MLFLCISVEIHIQIYYNHCMELCVVVIWFNPDRQAVDNILQYCDLCSKIYIVDNSTTNNVHMASSIPNSVYKANLKNEGIAAALNAGCGAAIRDGFDWCMTMDQDSSWDGNALMQFIAAITREKNKKRVCFAPSHTNKIKSVVGKLRYTIQNDAISEINFPDKVMTSGSIISLQIWQGIGRFNESLFIDEVDHEFCYRLWEAGYEICEFPRIAMIHTLGQERRTLLPRPCKHSGIRLYYIFRNILYIKRKFPYFYTRNGYKKYMLVACLQKILECNWKDLSFIHQGVKAARRGETGKYVDSAESKKEQI